MSFFLGGGNKSKPQFTGLSVQTSTNALPITLGWGQNRVAPNIIWQGDFQAHKQKQGKGGGKSVTTYTYSASFQLGLCWGEIHDVVTIWKDKSKMNAATTPNIIGKLKGGSAWAFFKGTTPQDPWGYMTTKHPDEALGYPGIAHADIANYDLGQTNTLGQHSFEIQALRWNTAKGGATGALDADPALILTDYLTDPVFGVGFDLDVISNLYSTGDATTTGDGTFQTYCRAMGFGLSPFLTEQKEATDTIERWAMLCNSAVTWNGYQLKFFPWGAATVTANGVTYVPNFPVRYTLTDKDFTADSQTDPVQMTRVDPADAYNSLSMIISNRANEYNELPVPWRDQGLVDQFGLRKDENLIAHEITEQAMAEIVVALIGQRKAYVRNSFSFKLPVKFCLLEPMDVLTLVDRKFGTFNVILREVVENDDGDLELVADEYNESVSTPGSNVAQGVTNTPQNTAVESGPANPPIIFEPPSILTQGQPQVWVGLSGGDGTTFDPNWGGAIVWLSTDNSQYVEIGTITDVARMGKLTANLADYIGTNPDTTNTLKVSLLMSGGELESEASAFDAANGSNACYVDGEFISFEVPTLTGSYAYDLTTLYRGLYGSTVDAHLTDSEFLFLDDAVFKYTLPPEYIGKTLYLKFQSQNIYDLTSEVLSDLPYYTFTPDGAAFGTGAGGVPSTPTGLAGSAGSVFAKLTWTANSANDNVTGYEVWRATGSGASFGSATKIATVGPSATEYVDASAQALTAYTYFLVAINDIGPSTNTTGINLTPSDSTAPTAFGFAFQWPDPTVSKPIAYFDSPIAWNLPSGIPNSQGSIGDSPTNNASAPTAQTDFDIQSPPGTSIGTMRFAASSLTATFIFASAQSIPLGQAVAIVAPSNLNSLRGMVYGSIRGTK